MVPWWRVTADHRRLADLLILLRRAPAAADAADNHLLAVTGSVIKLETTRASDCPRLYRIAIACVPMKVLLEPTPEP